MQMATTPLSRRISSTDQVRLQRIPWEDLEADFLAEQEQGEHVGAFGPSGVGKSLVLFHLAEQRVVERKAFVCILANKRRDPTLQRLLSQGYRRIQEWPPTYQDRQNHRIVFWPPYPGPSDPKRYVKQFMEALDGIMAEGNWTVVVDEARYWSEQMGLRTQLDELWTGARSNGVTIYAGAQGPSWIPTAAKENLSWGIFFRPQHRERAKETADITGDRNIYEELQELGPHEFILMRLKTQEAYISKLPYPPKRS